MIRNSIDHGIEQPEFRVLQEKDETGTLEIDVTSQDGNWQDTSTWLHGDVWDLASGIVFPNDNTSDGDSTISSIVEINHNVYLNQPKDGLTQMGLIIAK